MAHVYVEYINVYNTTACDMVTSYHFLWVIIPFVLHGLSLLLVFMTTLEFICAQAPLQMKGVLVSLWYASEAVSYLFIGVSEDYITDSKAWKIYQSVKIGLIFISLVAYVVVSKRYRYCLRDEVVNEQYLVEEVYERELALAEQYEQEQLLEDPNSVTSVYGTVTGE